jgi:23S rRNA (cytosine1962-C5)-methyltransferase
MSAAAVILNRKVTHRLLAGHLWVYATEIERVEGTPVVGDVVAVKDAAGRALAWGFFNPQSKIAVRVLTRQQRAIDTAFLRERIAAAIAHRERVLPGRPARRLVSSEGDLLPGLIVDQYGDTLVVQCTTAGIDRRLGEIVTLLQELLSPRVVIERNDLSVRGYEGLPQRRGVLVGEHRGPLRVRVGAADFPCDPLDPHKTGLYLDQQVNWEQVATFVRPGMTMLDVCCHLGGFGIHGALAGAGEILAIDTAEDSITGATQTAEWAGVGARFQTRCANAFDVLKDLDASNARYDLIVLDPPSFTRTRAAIEGALRGYKEIHLRALRMLAPGGVLATYSCSHHITGQMFLDMVTDAAADARRTLRREAVQGASPDHPVIAAVPESEYLKGYVFRVLDA